MQHALEINDKLDGFEKEHEKAVQDKEVMNEIERMNKRISDEEVEKMKMRMLN